MATLEKAIEIAAQVHEKQVDKAGEVYILHPLRLMLKMDTPLKMIVAVLHDVVEDSALNLEDLKAKGFSDTVLSSIDCLSRRPGEDYQKFIERVALNDTAREVKIADLEDNMNLQRLKKLDEKGLKRLEKYHKAWLRLR
ncbi:GTP pyrophosphokinase [candidate division CSSED10-310 bacterium]|uniref:GTP pyrophosphokinase n=1 Tax=candidate division CSSED10-310 bacterium TaxID=2855610 RepID=A0ABV6Z0A8_UNCC1